MNEFETLAQTLALTMGVGWASGINLYAAILVLGVGGLTGNIALPETLQVVQNPLVVGAAGLMYFVEFFADKTPGVDTGWDSIHTFIRIPAGAMLAAGTVGDVTPALEIAAGILGGSMAAGSHATKAGTRVMINTSPEPFTNWTASITEDVAVFAGLWAALNHPWIFLGLMVLFILLMIWFLPKLWRGIKVVFRKFAGLFGYKTNEPVEVGDTPTVGDGSTDPLDRIARLKQLLDSGAITQQEFDQQKAALLKTASQSSLQ